MNSSVLHDNDASKRQLSWLMPWGRPVCDPHGESTLCLGPISSPSVGTLAVIVILYLALIQLLRFRRQHEIADFVASESPLSPLSAQKVYHKIAKMEFPMVNKLSLQFALFRTYGIPTISGVLQKTTLFSNPTTAGRRYVDTTVLLYEFIGQTYGTAAWIKPMARTNAIHGHYRDKGKILEADMLYTLVLFAQQPWRWIDKFEWRTLSEAEIDAVGTFWKAIGEAMEIDYTGLQVPGWTEVDTAPMTANGRGKGTWKTGAEWLRALDGWAEVYESKYMLPSDSNAAVAEQSIMLLLEDVPKFMHPLGRQVISSLMDARLRRAMSIKSPPVAIHCITHTILILRKLFIRYLLPPRPEFLQVKTMTDLEERPVDGRGHLMDYDNVPLYVRPTVFNRWGLRAWWRWLAGRPLPGDPGTDPEGYFADKAGPPVGKAPKEQVKRETMIAEVLQGRGCPMAFR